MHALYSVLDLIHVLEASYVILFFFQAQDGIRDGHVTGVQTCALPISRPGRSLCARWPPGRTCCSDPRTSVPPSRASWTRSEERRVGKEWRSWWWAAHGKKNGYEIR